MNQSLLVVSSSFLYDSVHGLKACENEWRLQLFNDLRKFNVCKKEDEEG